MLPKSDVEALLNKVELLLRLITAPLFVPTLHSFGFESLLHKCL